MGAACSGYADSLCDELVGMMATRSRRHAKRNNSARLSAAEPLECRRMLAVQASLVSGELRISFTPSSTVPEQVAWL
ncbi:MAG: hypothetical protein DWH83_03285, partial [Planctomycetota bacterium]